MKEGLVTFMAGCPILNKYHTLVLNGTKSWGEQLRERIEWNVTPTHDDAGA
jgi:hypothetical protein